MRRSRDHEREEFEQWRTWSGARRHWENYVWSLSPVCPALFTLAYWAIASRHETTLRNLTAREVRRRRERA